MEIVYRGLPPVTVKDFWISNGFKEHLTRDNLLLISKDNQQVILGENSINIKFANSYEETGKITELFQNELDTYTSDAKSLAEITGYVNNENVLCAYYDNEFCGALQFEWKNNICWLGHIAIDNQFRGKGIANHLVAEYIRINSVNDNAKFQLWVINENQPAIKLYSKFGFRYTGKSTVSLLRF
jgi:ribosomal protein S18 acetylase RimI-like enzyme